MKSVLQFIINVLPLYRVNRNEFVGYFAEQITTVDMLFPDQFKDYDRLLATKSFLRAYPTAALTKWIIQLTERLEYKRSVKAYPKQNVKLAEDLRAWGELDSNTDFYSVCQYGMQSYVFRKEELLRDANILGLVKSNGK